MDNGIGLRSLLLADDSLTNLIGARVHHNHVPSKPGNNYVWFAQSTTFENDVIDAAVGDDPQSITYDVECVSLAAQADAVAMKTRVRAVLNKYRGTIGDSTTQGIFVEELPENYEPKGIPGDQGAYVQACRVQVFA